MQSDDERSENADRNSSRRRLKKLLKSHQRTGIFTCNLESCDRYYQSKSAFNKHLRKKHYALLSINDNPGSTIENFQNVLVDENEAIDQNETVNNNDVFEAINEPLKTDKEVLNGLESTALIFLSDMHANPCVNRKTAGHTFSNAKETILAKVCKAISSKIENSQLNDGEQKTDILNFVDSCSKICDFVDSEHLFLKHLKDRKLYVAPQKKVVNYEMRQIRNSGFPIPILKQIEVIEVPLRKSLKTFFELPGILNETIMYQNSLMTEYTEDNEDMGENEPTVYKNIVQGTLWKNYIKKYEGKTVIPFLLYSDDYGVNNQLGSHAKDQSICGFYIIFPTLPPEIKSRLENILLTLIFNSSVLKEAGNEKTLKVLVDEINFVQREGIDICVDGEIRKIFFKMTLAIGDNKGLNAILDFVQSFFAFYCCRFCRVHREVMHYMTKLDYSLLRNRSNYLEDIENDVSEGGVHKDSIFNSVDGFHVTENPSVDTMHDFYEKVAHRGICKSLTYFIYERKFFTLQTFNSRKAKFNYGINDSANLSGPIKKKHLENDKLKASASEMIILVQHLLTIIGDLVPRNDKYWLYLVNLVEIHDILIYKEISNFDLEQLKLLITKHHKSYIRVFKDHLRPTFHNMLHYYDIIKEIGPLSEISSLRGEAKHRNFKITAESTCSRKNIPLTLAIKNQLVHSNRLLKSKELQEENITSRKGKTLDVTKLEEYNFIKDQIDLTKSYQTVKQVERGCKKVVIGMFGMCFESSLKFYKIQHILIQSGSGNVMFLTQEYLNTGYDRHYLAYVIKRKPKSYKILTGEDFARFPNESHFLINRKQVIRPTHY